MGNVVGSTCSFELRTSFGISHRAFVWSEEHWCFNYARCECDSPCAPTV